MSFVGWFFDVARARVQHQPNEVFRIQTNFDEVVAATERAELLHRFRFAVVNAFVKIFELVPAFPVRRLVNRLLMFTESEYSPFGGGLICIQLIVIGFTSSGRNASCTAAWVVPVKKLFNFVNPEIL